MASATTAFTPRRARDPAALGPDDPLIPRLLLGRRLRELRADGSWTRARAAEAAGCAPSTITRVEQGRTAVGHGVLTALLDLYGVHDDAERATLHTLADQTHARPWWYDHRDAVPRDRGRYLSAERAGRLVRCYSDRYLPELLRTAAYARALARHERPPSGDRHLELLARRQRILRRRPRPVNLWVVLDETVLWRPVGDAATMRAQLEHLVEMSWRPNVTVQIARYDVCRRVAADGPLTLIRFPQQNLPDLVALDRDGRTAYPVRPAEIERHWHIFNTLVIEAAPPEHTPGIVKDALADYRMREIRHRVQAAP